jgi:hypothetical protein
MPNIWRTVVSWAAAALVGGCGFGQVPHTARFALLAPFEGEYRYIGYNALYAAQLAFQEAGTWSALLAVDDGGTLELAAERAAALKRDSSVVGVVVVGPFSTQARIQAQLSGIPLVIAGSWNAVPLYPHVVQLAPSVQSMPQLLNSISDERADHPRAPAGTRFLSAGVLPDDEYTLRYQALNPYTPSPNTYATLVTDAFALLIESHRSGTPLRSTAIHGINGHIAFDAQGFWLNASAFVYEITDAGYHVIRLDQTSD